jgi:hypothetical protein
MNSRVTEAHKTIADAVETVRQETVKAILNELSGLEPDVEMGDDEADAWQDGVRSSVEVVERYYSNP